MPKNFAIIGVGGYIAPRHLKAIRDTGNRIIAAADPKDSVGVLDSYSFDVRFFPEIERLDRHLEKLKRGPEADRVHYVTVCSPNYLHDAHARFGLRLGADVICEKPLVLSPWNLDALAAVEEETHRRIWTVLQLRVHEKLQQLREKLLLEARTTHEVDLTYITARGNWYDVSWKGDEGKSGGVMANIGIHFFDLLLWLFGKPVREDLHLLERQRAGGVLELERARVRWFISIDRNDLPVPPTPGKSSTFRSITVDGHEVEFSEGFTDLHTRVYQQTLEGRGFGLDDARAAIELVHRLRSGPRVAPGAGAHARVLARAR